MSKNKFWFRAKNYGWSWYPVTWEGWTAILIYILFIFYRGINPTKNYSLEVIIATIPLILISYLKGERPSWRWGNDRPKKNIKN